MFKVFQVELSQEKADEVNAAGCWSKVAWGKAYLDLTNGFGEMNMDMVLEAAKFGLIRHTMTIDCEELEEAFALGNGMGDMSNVIEHCQHKSASVGDIFIRADHRGGGITKSFGFELLSEQEVKLFESIVPQRMGLV